MEACSGDDIARRRRQAAEGVWAPKKNDGKAARVKKGHRIFLTVRKTVRKAVRNPFFVPRKFRHIEIAKNKRRKERVIWKEERKE